VRDARIKNLNELREVKMLLFIETMLTIIAWKRGWKWRAILPISIALVASFLTGFIMGAKGAQENDSPISMIFDAVVILTLIVMIIKRPSPKPAGSVLQPPLNQDTLISSGHQNDENSDAGKFEKR
jgi:hypothetical protein